MEKVEPWICPAIKVFDHPGLAASTQAKRNYCSYFVANSIASRAHDEGGKFVFQAKELREIPLKA